MTLTKTLYTLISILTLSNEQGTILRIMSSQPCAQVLCVSSCRSCDWNGVLAADFGKIDFVIC